MELLRPRNCLLAGLAVLIGVYVAGRVASREGFYWEAIDQIRAALAFAAATLITGAGNAINDYFDRKIDRVNRPERPIPSGRVKASDALSLSQALFIIGIALTIYLNVACLLLAGLNALVLALYAAGLKRRGLVGNIAIGYLVGSTFLFGGLAIQEIWVDALPAVGILAAMAALSTVGRELIKDVEDMRGDRASGLSTFPLQHGTRKAAVAAAIFVGAAVVLAPLPYLLGMFGKYYLWVVTLSIIAFLWSTTLILRSQGRRAASNASVGCKIAMGLGLLAFLAGAVA